MATTALLAGGATSAQLTADAGPDIILTHPAQLTLNGTVGGRKAVEFWTADGNGTEENKLVKYSSSTGITTAGPIQTSGGAVYGFVNDLVRIGGVNYGVAPLLQVLFTLDEFTGVATPVGSPMGSPSIRGLAYDEAGDLLYGVDYNTNDIVTIDRTTGLATVVVNNIGRSKTRCLAFNPANGLLYGWGESGDFLFTVDPATGTVTDLFLLPRTADDIYDDMQFFDGELYAVMWNFMTFDTKLQHIDLGTQLIDQVGSTVPDVSAHCLQLNSLPEPTLWNKVRGRGTVTFNDPEELSTTVTFSNPATYVLRLSVFGDSETVSDTLTVQVVAANPGGSPGGEPVTPPAGTPTVSFASTSQSVNENAGSVSVTVQLSAPLNDNVTIPLTLGGTATASSDYSASPNPIVISAGLMSADVTLTINDDSTDEEDETIAITLGQPSGAGLGSVTQHVATIGDDDPSPTVSFSSAGQSLDESSGAQALTVQLSALSERDVTVPFSLAGSATSPDDYTITSSPLVIPAGQMNGSLTLTLIDDTDDEVDETVQIDLSSPTNATLGATPQHIATIQDNDGPSVAFTAPTQSLGEAAGSTVATVQLSATSPQDVTIPFTFGGTATDPADYTATASPIVITAGQSSADITLTLMDDSLDENDETVSITLGSPTGATLGATTQHVATLTDDDAEPTLDFTSAAQSVSENAGSATITAMLSTLSGRDVTVPFNVGGTANNPLDYTITSSPITILAGQISADITVTIVDDGSSETDEVVGVTLTAPSGAILGTTTAHTLTILDDDGTESGRSELTVEPAQARIAFGTTLRLTVASEDLGRVDWTLDTPAAASFLETRGAHASGTFVHLVAGNSAATLRVTATDVESGRSGTSEITLVARTFDIAHVLDVPGDPRRGLNGAALAFAKGRAVFSLNQTERRGTLLAFDTESKKLSATAPRPVLSPSAIRSIAFDGKSRAWALVEGEGQVHLTAFDRRLRQLDLGHPLAQPMPLLDFQDHAVLGKRLVAIHGQGGGALSALDPYGGPLGTLPLPAHLDTSSLIYLASTPDGAWLVTDGETIQRIEADGQGGSFEAPSFAGTIAALSVSGRGEVFVAVRGDSETTVHVLDLLGREVQTLGAAESGSLPWGDLLAFAADEHGRLMIYTGGQESTSLEIAEPMETGVPDQPKQVAAQLWLVTPVEDGVERSLAIEPREAWLRPGLVQTFVADVEGGGGWIWRTETGVFIDTGLEFSHANPAYLIGGNQAGEFEVTLEFDGEELPAARAKVIITGMPTTDHVHLIPTDSDGNK